MTIKLCLDTHNYPLRDSTAQLAVSALHFKGRYCIHKYMRLFQTLTLINPYQLRRDWSKPKVCRSKFVLESLRHFRSKRFRHCQLCSFPAPRISFLLSMGRHFPKLITFYHFPPHIIYVIQRSNIELYLFFCEYFYNYDFSLLTFSGRINARCHLYKIV